MRLYIIPLAPVVRAQYYGYSSSVEDGYGSPDASAQYHRHAYPYNTPFYATSRIRGLQPGFDSYEAFASLVKETGRDFSIVPEFNISEHVAQ